MWVGVLLKLGGSKVIYDVHEDLPKQIIGKPYSEGLLFAIGQAYQREVPPEIARPLK